MNDASRSLPRPMSTFKECVFCGAEYIAYGNISASKFCGIRCQQANYRRERRAREKLFRPNLEQTRGTQTALGMMTTRGSAEEHLSHSLDPAAIERLKSREITTDLKGNEINPEEAFTQALALKGDQAPANTPEKPKPRSLTGEERDRALKKYLEDNKEHMTIIETKEDKRKKNGVRGTVTRPPDNESLSDPDLD